MRWTRGPVFALLTRFASRLRFPTLFWVTAALFVIDLLVPDLIPFADEVLLGLLTLLLGSLRGRTGTSPNGSTGNGAGAG